MNLRLGSWCVFFHAYPDPPERKELGNREFKHQLVLRNGTHAALVFDGDVAVAWAQYGPVAELPNIHHRKDWPASSSAPRARATAS